jgi:hypothetical protein
LINSTEDKQGNENIQILQDGSVVKHNQQEQPTEETLQLHRERCLAKLLAQDVSD